MVGIHQFTGLDMGISIILTTLVVRTFMVPLMRRQMVSMRRMQSVAPEIKEIQRRYKSDRVKQQQATMALYKERGISQAGCLVAILPLLLILPMYQVVSEGLRAADLAESLKVFGTQLVPLTCPPPQAIIDAATGAITGFKPCIDSVDPVARRPRCRRPRRDHPVRVHVAAGDHEPHRDLAVRDLLH